ncbi:MAG: VacB/RNase II family 3'-5' exoribonuclease [Chitinophagales bacterium]|jgi:ribonuclease R|nr:VacB/RNase II family 3'-5' exoribonuclease [Chitinophagales bacterium]
MREKNLAQRILALYNHPDKTFTFDRLKHLLPKKYTPQEIQESLNILYDKNILFVNGEEIGFISSLNQKQNTKSIKKTPKITEKTKNYKSYIGIIDMSASGKIFVVSEELTVDAKLSEKTKARFFPNDQVRFTLVNKEGNRPIVDKIELIAREKKLFRGHLKVNTQGKYNVYFVSTHPKKLPFDIFVSDIHLNGAKDGDYVVVEILNWYDEEKSPRGRIKETLSNLPSNEQEMRSILLEQGFDIEFSQDTLEELNRFTHDFRLDNRVDFRGITTFTIDPRDAKDFDDALSVKYLENNQIEVGIHIADVSHFVREKSLIDQAAYDRATSVYLPDRVAPMLPELLSNDLCSLKPNEERYAFSVICVLDQSANILSYDIQKTLIRSDYRFAYEDAQAYIEGGNGPYDREVLTLHDLSQKLRAKRMKSGGFEFNSKEIRFELDANKKPTKVILKVQKDANKLIEEFMLLANVLVAEELSKGIQESKIPGAVFRVHDIPQLEKLKQFTQIVESKFDISFPQITHQNASHALNEFFAKIADNPEFDVYSKFAIRAMAKAIYDTDNIGHYGLGFSDYVHFTSPIRRYPDLVVHRLLFDLIHHKKSKYTDETLKSISAHCSNQEKKAADCERQAIKYKQLEYLENYINQDFEGIITGMVFSGFWVELRDNFCEGFVEIKANFNQSFVFDPILLILESQDKQIKLQIGDKVRVKIQMINLKNYKAEFSFLEKMKPSRD